VYVQAEGKYRATTKNMAILFCGRTPGTDSTGQLREDRADANPQVISHYNLVPFSGNQRIGSAGRSSGQAIADMEALAKKSLPGGMTYDWSGLSLEENSVGRKAGDFCFGMGLVFVYLTWRRSRKFRAAFIVLLAVRWRAGRRGRASLRGRITMCNARSGW